jgi:HEAT repeat protein
MNKVQELIAGLTSGDDAQAETAVSGLAGQGKASLPALQEFLSMNAGQSTAQIDARWWALRALAEIPDPGVIPLMIGALGDADPGIRQCAALGLRKQPDPQAVPALVRALEDEDRLVRSLAADALATTGQPAVPALLEILHDGPQAARLEAVRALALIGDHRSIQALMAAIQEDSALMEYWANEGLERMGLGMAFFKP